MHDFTRGPVRARRRGQWIGGRCPSCSRPLSTHPHQRHGRSAGRQGSRGCPTLGGSLYPIPSAVRPAQARARSVTPDPVTFSPAPRAPRTPPLNGLTRRERGRRPGRPRNRDRPTDPRAADDGRGGHSSGPGAVLGGLRRGGLDGRDGGGTRDESVRSVRRGSSDLASNRISDRPTKEALIPPGRYKQFLDVGSTCSQPSEEYRLQQQSEGL
jgi:hypothetical protein